MRQGTGRDYLCQKNNPFVIGLGKGENYIASDIPAIISKTRDTYILSDGEMAIVKADSVVVKDLEGHPIDKRSSVLLGTPKLQKRAGLSTSC